MVLKDYIKLRYNNYDIIIISQFSPLIAQETCKLQEDLNKVKTINVETNIKTMDNIVMKDLEQTDKKLLK